MEQGPGNRSQILLERLRQASEGQRSSAIAPKLRPRRDVDLKPLSFAQEGLWFLDRLGLARSAYNMPAAVRLEGRLDIAALERSVEELVRRHESLRTRFVAVDGVPEQVVDPPPRRSMEVLDLSAMEPEARERRVAAVIRDESTRSFDLSTGPLFRPRLLSLGPDEHVLLMTTHHIVSDDWSYRVLLRELGAIYGAFSKNLSSPLPEPELQYSDYALWQREMLAERHAEPHLAYWREQLAGAPARLELPTDRPRPMAESFQGATLPLKLSAPLTRDLLKLAQELGATPYMVMLAAFQIVLSRWSGQSDISVGAAVAGRGKRELENMVGFFVNTLVLRTDLSGDPTVRELVGRVKKVALGAFAHQDLPLDKLVRELAPVRDLGRQALFQASLTLHVATGEGDELRGLKWSRIKPPTDTAKLDLALSFTVTTEGIVGEFEYATDLFDASTIGRMAEHLGHLLEQMVASPDESLGQIDILPPAERTLLLETWNATEADYPEAACVQDLFEAQVRRDPAATAVVFGDERLTYGELNARANRLAHHLIAEGVGPDDRVAICMERSLEMVVGLLAVLKAGGAYVPLDPAYPAERLGFMLADSAPRLVLTHGPAREALAAAQAGLDTSLGVLDLEADVGRWGDQPDTDPNRQVLGLTSRHLAYVIYTSGSTGTPKGVMVEHRNLLNLIGDVGRWCDLPAKPTVLSLTAISFDICGLELFVPLTQGGCLVVGPGAGRQEASVFAEIIAHRRPDLIQATPSAWRSLAPVVKGLPVALCGGEALPPDLAGVLQGVAAKAINVYGPTETTIWSTAHRLGGDDGPIPIGRPIANTRIYLLDDHGRPVPLGAIGEIHIGGAGVARGYLNRPELTAEKFVASPFVAGDRLYKTGDLARYLTNGDIEFVGRNDHQVKIRGFRIELGEIEARLAELGEVSEVAVLAREDVAGERRLVAYYVASEEIGAEVLRAHLAAGLPDHMVPAAYVWLDHLPLTPNGKLDRKALPAPGEEAFARKAYEAPQGEVEEALAAIWSELLGVEKVGRHDNFFELGGHSLLAARVCARMQGALAVALPLAAIFAQPTVASLAQAVAASPASSLAPAITAAAREGPLALSFAQQRLWFLDQLEGASATYNIPLALRLRGQLDVAAWRRSLQALFARHEALRSVFVTGEDGPQVRLLEADVDVPLSAHDLRGLPDAEAQLAALGAEEVTTPFDLAEGPLVRGRLVRLAEDEHVVLLTLHHIIADGWSMSVMSREFAAFYAAFSTGQESPLAPLQVQYPDYALWQRRWLTGERLAAQADYWRGALAGAPGLLELPTDRPRPPQQDFAGAFLPIEISAELTLGLKRLAQRHGATLFTTLLSAWAVVLARLSGQTDLVIGAPTANRNQREVEDLIGFFVNTLALRLDLSHDPSVAELMDQARSVALAAQEHQDLPFEQVVEIVKPPRRLDHAPLFQVIFAWQNNAEASGELPGLAVRQDPIALQRIKFDLDLSLAEQDDAIAGALGYATALFDRATIERHRDYLLATLQAMVDNDHQAVMAIDILPPAERTLLLETWNATEADWHAIAVRAADGTGATNASHRRLTPTGRVYLLDRFQRPVPPGAVGDIWIGGDESVGSYLVQLGRTVEQSIPSPFKRGDWLYGTGDHARCQPDGRIELVERDSLAFSDPDVSGRPPHEAPQGEVEEALAAIWSELLGVEKVGRHDNFFELGGHSLLAIELRDRLRNRGFTANVRTLFTTPTLSDLATNLGRDQDVVAPPNLITPGLDRLTPDLLPLIDLTQADIDAVVARTPGGLANIQDIYALSPLQEGILFHHLLVQEGDPYLQVSLIAFTDRALLDRALAAVQEVINRHDVLRTSFLWEGLSSPAQVIWREAPLRVTEVDLSPRHGPIAEQLQRRFDPRRHRIDIREAPLLRFAVAFDAEHGRWLMLPLMHHLIGDHPTLEFLLEEVGAILDGRSEGLPPSQPFRNLVAQARLGVSAAEHEAFFRAQLGDIDEPTTPFGLTDVRGDGGQVGEAQVMLSTELNDRLRRQARRLRVSLASLCHLAWGQVLARGSGRRSVVFGTVLFGRLNAGEVAGERAMGLFMNTLPLRLELDATSVESSVRGVHDRLADLLRHEHATLAVAQRCSGVAAGAPLFNTVFNYRHNSPAAASVQGAGTAGELAASGIDWLSKEERTNYPFSVMVEDFGRCLGLTVQVVEPLSPERVCGYMHQALESLADALEEAPAMPVRQLEVLPPAERTLLLETWNATEADYPEAACVQDLFEAQVRRDPAATAVVFGDERLTYGELNARANRLAHHLIAEGVGPDDRVAICMERSLEMVVGLLAVLKAGGAYVPLDPAYPAERLGFMLADSAPRLVLTHGPAREALAAAQAGLDTSLGVLDLEADVGRWGDQPDTDPNRQVLGLTSRHLAYVIYTSGSTGTPKGVMVEHRNIVAYLSWAIALYQPTIGAPTPVNTSISFDATATSLLTPLCSGGHAWLLPEGHGELTALGELLAQHRGCSLVKLTPAHLDGLSRGVEGATDERAARVLVIGGEALMSHQVEAWRAQAPGTRLINEYGPTETTVGVVVFEIDPHTPSIGAIPIGRPIANTRIYLLDDHGRPVPLGAIGEIHIGGAGVARGYLNRPELTAEKFVASPFVAGDRLYKTGDLARYLTNGDIEFVGRNDHQVKIRGFRIELGEIEARLAELGEVSEVAVLAREDVAGERRLVAYYVASEEIGAEVLRAHLAAGLPDHMVPAAYVWLDHLPLTPNGKLDRKALPAPGEEAFARKAYEAPQGEVEEALAAIWSELLGVEKVGRHDNFFELGGHSLLAVRMIGRSADLGLTIRIESLFLAPVLSDLATLLEATATRSDQEIVLLRRTSDDRAVFFVPSGLGSYEYAVALAERMPTGPTLYAVPWPEVDFASHTIDALAGLAVTAIRRVQGSGPYHLAGYSSGGAFAYAIAEQLLAQGEAVAFLGLIDVDLPAKADRAFGDARDALIDTIKDHARRSGSEERRHLPDEADLRTVIAEAQDLGAIPSWLDGEKWTRAHQFDLALRSYDPPKLPLVIHQFYAAARAVPNAAAMGQARPFTRGWDAVVPAASIRVIDIPGDHFSIVSAPEGLAALGARVSEALEQAFR